MSGFKNIQVLLSADAGNLRRVLNQSAGEVDRFANRVGLANTGLNKSTIAMAGAAAGAAAVAVGLAYAADKAIEFDKNMRNVNSLTGLTEDAFKSLEDQVVSLSKTLPQSAADLAAGLYDIASSGFQGADGLKVLESAAAAASAGLTTTANSAQAITAVLNAYGLTAKDAADVSDVLFQTVNLGVINFESLSGVIGDVVGTAAAAKVGIDQVGAAIATMTLTGITGSEAGTSLNRVLQSILQPSEALAGLYEKLGYESGAAALEQKGLRGVMDDVREATGGNITTLLELFPEIRSARGALALMANEGKNYAKVAGEITDKDKRRGATMKTLKEQMKATANQAALFKNGIDAIAISVGVKLLPVLNGLMAAATDAGAAMEDGIAAVSEKLQPTWEALSNIGQDLWDILVALGNAVKPFAEGLLTLAGGAVITALNLLSTALEKITGFLADNIPVVFMLAAAYATTLVPALARTVAFNAQMIAFIVRSTVSMAALRGGVSALAASLMTLASAEAVATLGITLIVGAIAAGVNGLSEAEQSAKDFAASFTDGVNALDPVDVKTRLDKINAAFLESRKVADAYFGSDSGWDNFLGQMKAGWELITPLDNTAADATAKMDALQAAWHKLDEEQANATSNMSWAASAFDMTNTQVQNLAKAAGVDLTGAFSDVSSKLQTFYDTTNGASSAETDLVKAMGELAGSAGDAGEKVDALKKSMDALLGIPMDLDKAMSDFQATLDKMTDSLIANGKSVDIHTEKGRANREAIRNTVQALEDQIVAMANSGKSGDEMAAALRKGTDDIYAQGAAAGFSEKQMKDLLHQFGLTPDKVETLVRAAGADSAKTDVEKLQAEIDMLKGKTVTVNIESVYSQKGSAYAPGGSIYNSQVPKQANLFGGINRFANGGMLPSQAMVAPNGANLVQWAEKGTGGEAFIPLSPGKRNRSERILEQVAMLFGKQLTSFADGGYYNDAEYRRAVEAARREAAARASEANKGASSTGSDGKPKTAKQRAADKKAAAAEKKRIAEEKKRKIEEARDAAYKRAADRAEQKRLAIQVKPGDAQVSFDPRSIMGSTQSRLETNAQNKAQLAAMKSANPYDTADDFYKKPKAGIKDFQADIDQQVKNMKDWKSDLSRISKVAGADVAANLKAMGAEGYDLVNAMANGTDAEIKRMAASLKSLGPTAKEAMNDFAEALHMDATRNSQFAQDLLKITQMGRADIAQQLLAMGPEQGAQIASAIASGQMSEAQMNQASADIAANAKANDSDFATALKLAGVLRGSGTPLGVIGLANASGVSVSDVMGILHKYGQDVFSHIGAAYSQVAADLDLVNAGKQPSGLARGGIVTGNQTGMYYQWAEQGTGGESLIPLGMKNRARSLDLWQETGRLLGARQSATAGGTIVTIGKDAVNVSLRVDGSSMSPAEIQAVANAAVNSGMDRLANRLRGGAGKGN